MNGIILKFTFLLLFLLTGTVNAGQAVIQSMRLWSAPDHTRLVFDVDAAVEHKIFTLKSPDRLVIDISNARLTVKPQQATSQDQFIRQVRFGKQDKRNSRIVLDLKKTVQPRSFVLKPNKQYGHRLVVDVYQKASDSKQKSKSVKTVSKTYHRDVVIAIDAGHGGEDPGASGAKGSKEKRVTLAIAKKLKALVDAEKGMSAVLTRKGDYYIPLRQRMDIARKYKADLFVSIHADAFKDPRASGASVYVLSRRGASSEAAKWLAKQENAADLIGGVKLGDKDDVLASVLMDLSQSATIQASNGAAGQVLSQLKRLGKVHGRKVQRAGFMVLKSPDMPSMLVETAFISNPQEERRLNSAAHQKRLAKAILSGVKNYFQQSPPPGSLMASQQSQSDIVYIVKAGDTLSAIASRYQISLNVIRSYNKLRTDVLSIGKRLTIPARSDS